MTSARRDRDLRPSLRAADTVTVNLDDWEVDTVKRLQTLVTLELLTGVFAVVGGLLLIGAPDGHLLATNRNALANSPFVDWRMPGVLLVAFVGIGFLITAALQWLVPRIGWSMSLLAGCGLVAFETVEVVLLGFQPLQAIFGAVGVAVMILALGSPRSV
jgi:hypothetical protein